MYNKQMRNIIFIDLDGVITDWCTPAAELLGFDAGDPVVQAALIGSKTALDELAGAGEVDRCIDAAGISFWAKLKKLPWADELIQRVIDTKLGDVAFLSKPGKWLGAYTGKAMWQRDNYPNIPLILCRDKGMVASPDSFLIDDDRKQIRQFFARHGWTHHWKDQFYLMRAGPKLIKSELELLTSVLEESVGDDQLPLL